MKPDNILLGERGHVLLTYFCTLSQVEQAVDPVAVEELFVAPGLCSVGFEISEMKLQNCTFVEKFRLIVCLASFVLAIKKCNLRPKFHTNLIFLWSFVYILTGYM